MFGGFSFSHIVLLLLVVLLFGGARRLPELGSSLGRGLRNFKKGLDGSPTDDEKKDPELLTNDKSGSSSKPTSHKDDSGDHSS